MKIIYSLPHPYDRLDEEGAGHLVRARAMLNGLEANGHTVIRVQAAQASGSASQAAVSTYRQVVKRFIPRPIAMQMRDRARVAFGKQYAETLTEIVQRERPDAILETHVAFSLGGTIASEVSGVPLVLDDYAPTQEELKAYGVGSKKLLLDVHQRIIQQATYLVAVNDAMRQLLIEDGVPPHKLITISNGIRKDIFRADLDGSAYRQRYGITSDAVVIVFVGSFQHYHRVDLLLQAFAQLQTNRPAHLLLVGDGAKAEEARQLCADLHLNERVTFSGQVRYEDVPLHIAMADVAIMPATNDYGDPMKVYEYMAMGKATLAPNQPTITAIGTHAHDIYLFERENVPAMAHALKTVIESDALRQALGAHAITTVVDYTWERRSQQLAQHIEQAIGG
ncbi:MAG: glycosyltransferase family 4 protein [Phototrophicaceae bacterium]